MSEQLTEIVVAAGKRRSETVTFHHRAGAGGTRTLRVTLERDSVLDLQELHHGRGGSWRIQVELALEDGARMRQVAVVDGSGGARLEFDRQARLAQNAELHYIRVGSGAAKDREILRAGMQGAGSRFRHGALMLVEPGRHAELDLEIAHHARHAVSDSLCRWVLSANGRGKFGGKILITGNGQGANAQLRNDNLLLDETARMETRPELEVYADEVQCAHGAATGALDQAALFYLMTRGLSPAQARAMLVRAFASKVTNAIELPEAQQMAGEILNRALNDAAPQKLAA